MSLIERVELTEDKEIIIKFRFAQLDETAEARYRKGLRRPTRRKFPAEIAYNSRGAMYRAAAIASAEGDVSGGRDGPDGDATLTAVSEREKPASRREARSAGRAADINTSGTVSSADTGGIRPPGQ